MRSDSLKAELVRANESSTALDATALFNAEKSTDCARVSAHCRWAAMACAVAPASVSPWTAAAILVKSIERAKFATTAFCVSRTSSRHPTPQRHAEPLGWRRGRCEQGCAGWTQRRRGRGCSTATSRAGLGAFVRRVASALILCIVVHPRVVVHVPSLPRRCDAGFPLRRRSGHSHPRFTLKSSMTTSTGIGWQSVSGCSSGLELGERSVGSHDQEPCGVHLVGR